jgi:hypothetical protein
MSRRGNLSADKLGHCPFLVLDVLDLAPNKKLSPGRIQPLDPSYLTQTSRISLISPHKNLKSTHLIRQKHEQMPVIRSFEALVARLRDVVSNDAAALQTGQVTDSAHAGASPVVLFNLLDSDQRKEEMSVRRGLLRAIFESLDGSSQSSTIELPPTPSLTSFDPSKSKIIK